MLRSLMMVVVVLVNASCPSIHSKATFYKANKTPLKDMVKYKHHKAGQCQPVLSHLRCEQIATYGTKNRPYRECRAKVYGHDTYEGDLQIGSQRKDCFLIFHMVGTRVLRKPMQNRCHKVHRRKRAYTSWGPWSRCLTRSCGEESIQIKRRFCNGSACAEFDLDIWRRDGAQNNSLIHSRPCARCQRPSPPAPPEGKCVLDREYSERKSLINDEWPIDEYPRTLDDCDQFVWTENDVELDMCGCVDLINRTYTYLLDYLKEVEENVHRQYQLRGIEQPYPIREEDCHQFDFFDRNGKQYSDEECEEVRLGVLRQYYHTRTY